MGGKGSWKLSIGNEFVTGTCQTEKLNTHTQKNSNTKLSTVTERDHLVKCTLQFLENMGPAMEQLANWSILIS